MDLSLNKQPNELVDLHFKLASDSTTSNQNQTVTAIVRNGAGTAVTGSPFTLVHEANGRYVLRSAFTLGDEGTYTVDFDVANVRWEGGLWVIDCKYEEIGGVGASGGVDPVALGNLIDEIPRKVWRFDTSSIKNEKTAINQILNKLDIKIPETKIDLSEILTAIKTIPKNEFNENNFLISLGNIVDSKISKIVDFGDKINALETSLINKGSEIKNNQSGGFQDIKKLLQSSNNKNELAKLDNKSQSIIDTIKNNSVNKELKTALDILQIIKSEIQKIEVLENNITSRQNKSFDNLEKIIKNSNEVGVKRLALITNKIISKVNSVFKPNIKIDMNDNNKKFRK